MQTASLNVYLSKKNNPLLSIRYLKEDDYTDCLKH